jgi:hypothetical protein
MFDINDPATLDQLRCGVLSHLHSLVGFCVDQDRQFVTAAVRAQFGLELQVVSLGDVVMSPVAETWGLIYAPQEWRGKPASVLKTSSEDDRGTLEGFIRGLNYCRQGRGVVSEAADVPAFAERYAVRERPLRGVIV